VSQDVNPPIFFTVPGCDLPPGCAFMIAGEQNTA